MKKFSFLLNISFLGLFITSCGGAIAGIETSALLGKVPGLCLARDMELEQILEAYDALSAEEMDLAERLDAKIKERNKWYEDQFAAESEALAGNEIEVEIADGMPYKARQNITIQHVDANGKIVFGGEIEATEDIVVDHNCPRKMSSDLVFILVDAARHPILTIHPDRFFENSDGQIDTILTGQKIAIHESLQISRENAKDMMRFSKIVITNRQHNMVNKIAKDAGKVGRDPLGKRQKGRI